MSSPPAASVVVPVRGPADVLARQLTCLAEQSMSDFEVVVADNGAEGLDRVVDAWSERLTIRTVDAGGRIGCGPARNVGVAAARADTLLFCDADDLVAPEWVAALSAALEHHGVVTGAKALVRASEVDVDRRAQLFASARFSTGPNTAGSRPYASGNNAGYRRALLAAIGGFGSHNLRREDVEAGWLLADRGHTVAFVPEARLLYVVHDAARRRFWASYGYGAGLEALRRQFDDVRPLSTSAKVGLVRSARRPAELVPTSGSLAGQVSERIAPGRYFERIRRRAATDDARRARISEA